MLETGLKIVYLYRMPQTAVAVFAKSQQTRRALCHKYSNP
jgi:hypothetical protein